MEISEISEKFRVFSEKKVVVQGSPRQCQDQEQGPVLMGIVEAQRSRPCQGFV